MPGTRGKRQTKPLIFFYLLTSVVCFLDQLTKFFALSFLESGSTLPVIPQFFHLTLVYNTGIAFGLFNRHQNLLLVLITLSLIFLTYLGNRIPASQKLGRLGLALILGGAIGNWIDRLRYQAVIDFLDFRIWPVFNLADTAITLGVCLYFFLIIRGKREH